MYKKVSNKSLTILKNDEWNYRVGSYDKKAHIRRPVITTNNTL